MPDLSRPEKPAPPGMELISGLTTDCTPDRIAPPNVSFSQLAPFLILAPAQDRALAMPPKTPPPAKPSRLRTPDTPPERAAAFRELTPLPPSARVTSGRMMASPPDSPR